MRCSVQYPERVSRLIDTHFHLDLDEQPAALAAEIDRRQVYTVAVSNAPSFYRVMRDQLGEQRFVRLAVGLHPELVGKYAHELEDLLELMTETRYVGEVGMDGSTPHRETLRDQRRVFEQVVSRANDLGDRVLSIHSRRAEGAVIDVLGPTFSGTAILHWYSGPLSLVERALDVGAYFSINPAMCRSTVGKALIARLPRDRVLTETDGPFVQVKNQPAKPWDVVEVARALGTLWGLSDDDVRRQIHQNFGTALKQA